MIRILLAALAASALLGACSGATRIVQPFIEVLS